MKKKSFTLLEGILVIAILGIISVFAVIIFTRFQKTYELKTVSQEIIQTLKRAQNKAISQEGDQNWGVYFSNSEKKYVLFNTSYPAGSQENFSLPQTLLLNSDLVSGGIFNVTFNRLFGQTSAVNISLYTIGNQTKTIKVKSEGLIEVE